MDRSQYALRTYSKRLKKYALRIFYSRHHIYQLGLFAVLVGLSGCQSSSGIDDMTENEMRQRLNLYRPSIVLTYDRPHDTRVNNIVTIKEGINLYPAPDRQVIVVAKVGDGGASVAMERAQKIAALLAKSGEQQPRMYVRAQRASDRSAREQGVVELYSIPKSKWDDELFAGLMLTQSIEIKPLGGVLRSDVARLAMNEVYERQIIVEQNLLEHQITTTLAKLGWVVETKNIPNTNGPSNTYYLSLIESGEAYSSEAIELIRRIGVEANVVSLTIAVHEDERRLLVSYGTEKRK
ncbi:TPA: hypothetical protein I7682_17685 [Vibrio vulnificus]|nr:hypothetical protein [Vibrio vulnificus]